uniref:Uncharacterized protein n=1 Tax=Acrobeloides nanus TaxID=290746 RepID=A0A914D126_9BILA
MLQTCYEKTVDYTMSGMEVLLGRHGHHWIRTQWEHLESSILRNLLINSKNRKNLGRSNIVRSASKMEDKEIENFTKQVHVWYENRSRAYTQMSVISSALSNGIYSKDDMDCPICGNLTIHRKLSLPIPRPNIINNNYWFPKSQRVDIQVDEESDPVFC